MNTTNKTAQTKLFQIWDSEKKDWRRDEYSNSVEVWEGGAKAYAVAVEMNAAYRTRGRFLVKSA